jgi:hypothetical protein
MVPQRVRSRWSLHVKQITLCLINLATGFSSKDGISVQIDLFAQKVALENCTRQYQKPNTRRSSPIGDDS